MTDTLADITAALQTYVVAPLNAFGLGGFVFDVKTEEIATLTADITDHYTEDNKALQDHIALRPKRVTLRGFVGELVYNTPSGDNSSSIVQIVTQKLTVLSSYLPQISAAATQAQAAISGVDSAGGTLQSLAATIPAAANIYGLVQNSIGAFGINQKQQGAYQYFAACQSGGILMGIQTPWEFLTNMAIESIVAIQPEDSIFLSDFAITLKQIRIASTTTALTPLSGTGGLASPALNSQGATATQAALQTDIGIVPGQATTVLPTNPQAGLF